jgi:hypothetical protein
MSETMWWKTFCEEGGLDLIWNKILRRKGKCLGQEHSEFANVYNGMWFGTATYPSK